MQNKNKEYRNIRNEGFGIENNGRHHPPKCAKGNEMAAVKENR
jgi:hypothetical protein